MKIYLASSGIRELGDALNLARNIRAKPFTPNILLSYHYYKSPNIYEDFLHHFDVLPGMFLDSGAFSAMTQGTVINLDAYARYIKQHLSFLTIYANLDVIKNAEGTWKNQRYLEDHYNLSPLPVFHVGEPWSYLDRYIERYPYIALGVAATPASIYMPWLIKCFKRAYDKAVYHGFGITNWKVMNSFPWYSVDSTSWNRTGRFGIIWYFDERQKTLKMIKANDKKHYQACYNNSHAFRKYGLDPNSFIVRSPSNTSKGNAISICALLEAIEWLEQRWGKIEIPERSVS